MKNYTEYKFIAESAYHEIMIAYLSNYPFESFQELDDHILAWIPTDQIIENLNEEIKSLIPLSFEIESKSVENKNWNEVWESQFDPVIIDTFCCVRADFHVEDTSCQHEIIVNPKMAFGTGHHETTEMMIRHMRVIDFKDKSVFDFGTGTGILAILSSYLGAKDILAIDNDENAVNSTLENIQINKTPEIRVSIEDIATFSKTQYDIILANVNRSAILSNVSHLSSMCAEEGILVISGILLSDKLMVINEVVENDFSLEKIKKKDEWLSIKFVKKSY